MGKFLRLLLFFVLVGFLVSTNVSANPYPVEKFDTIYFDPGFRANRGGEFKVFDLPDDNSSRDYLFTSFCLERNEYLNFSNAFYIADISGAAQKGGISGANSEGKDPIADSTAWLYWQYSRGNLDNTVSGWSYGNANDAASLQNAIWVIEDEGAEGSFLYQYLIDAAVIAVAAGWNNDDGKVAVLNLKWGDANGQNAQDQLVAAVPEPATMLLLGVGLIGMAGFGRRKLKTK